MKEVPNIFEENKDRMYPFSLHGSYTTVLSHSRMKDYTYKLQFFTNVRFKTC